MRVDQRKMIKGLQFLNMENHKLRALMAALGEKIAKQDELTLQLQCIGDMLKKLRDRDYDHDPEA